MFFDAVLDLLFPPHCVSCRREGEWWCRACRDAVETPRVRFRYDGFDRIDVTGFYHDPRLRNAIHALKYDGLTAMRRDLVAYVRERKGDPADRPYVIQPLPADPSRVRERGFDHATFLAECLADALEISAPVADLLERRRGHGIAQAKIESPELRAANVRGVFRLTSNVIVPSRVLLVDDVITTGATMKEAARVLRAAGVQTISAFALARGA